jgi:hypothetical protein
MQARCGISGACPTVWFDGCYYAPPMSFHGLGGALPLIVVTLNHWRCTLRMVCLGIRRMEIKHELPCFVET